MQRIVINTCYGGFSLSAAAARLLDLQIDIRREVARNDEKLINAVESLGAEANGVFAELKIVEIPDGVEWEIVEYDGFEHVAEKHRRWF